MVAFLNVKVSLLAFLKLKCLLDTMPTFFFLGIVKILKGQVHACYA